MPKLDLTPILDLTPLDEEESDPLDQRPPRGEMLEPEISRPRITGEIPEVGGGIPPQLTDADIAEVQKQSKLGEEIAGTMAEADLVGQTARVFEPNLPRNLLAPTTEEFLSEGEKFRAGMPLEMRPWQQSPFRPPTTAAELSPETREGLAAEQALSGTLADLSSADQALVLGGAVATGGLPGAAGRILGAAVPATFGVEGAKSIYEGAKTLLSDDATPEERGQAQFQIGMGATMLPGLGALAKRPPVIVERVIAKAEAVVPGALSKSKAALADTAKRADVVVEETLPPLKQTPFDTSGMTAAELLRHEKFIEGAFGEKPIEVEQISDRPQQLTKPIEKGIPDESIQVQEAQWPKDVLKDVAREKEIEIELSNLAARRGRFDATNPRMEALRTEKRALQAKREAAPKAEPPGPEKFEVSVQAEDPANPGTGFVQIVDTAVKSEKSKSPTVESLRAAGVDVPDFTKLPTGKYTWKEAIEKAKTQTVATEGAPGTAGAKPITETAPTNAKVGTAAGNVTARANEKAIPSATEAAAESPGVAAEVPARQAPVVEPRVGAVPENVPALGAEAPKSYGSRYVAEQGVEGAMARIEHLRKRMEEAGPRQSENLASESDNIGRALLKADPNYDWVSNAIKPAQPLPEPAGQIKAGEEQLAPAASQAVRAENAPTETIKAAAIRAEDGTIYTGKWHPAAYEELMRDKGLTKDQTIRQQQEGKVADGFLTSSGRFVGREEAATIASRADQFRPDKEGDIAFAGGLKQNTLEAGPGKIAAKAQPELPGAEPETQGAIATMGPPLMPTPPAGAPAAPVKPISQIIRDLAKGLDLPIRFGRLTTGKYGGYFKKNPNLIGAKLANDMPIVAHEAGHKLDTIYPFTKDTSIFPELDALGDPSIAGSRSSWTPSKSKVYKRSEGLAEFIRHWLTDPAQAQKLAPNTHTLLERVLAANEDLNGTMRQAQADIQLWKNAPQEARLDSSISRSDPNKSRYRLPNLMRDLVDDLHFLRMAVDDAKVSGPLPPSQNPYQLARTLRGSFGMADTFVTKGIVDFKTKEVRPGTDLESALKPVSGRIDEFRRWIVAKRAQELRTQGKESGLNPGDVDFVADKYNSDRAFQEAFTKVKEWNDGLLQYAVDAGLIAPESAARMRELHQDYVPFHRLFEVGAGEAPAVSGGGSGRGLNAGKPGSLKRLTGSQRDIVDPLETMVKNAYTMITAAEKNAINAAVADLAPKSDMGRWVERVAAPKELVKVELERIRKQLEDAGADLANVPDDLLMGFFKPSGRAPFGENIIKVNRGGKQEFYRLDKDLFDTFHALDQDASSRLLKIMSAPAQLLRAGVTLTPDFALSNAIRDTFGAAVNSKYTSYPFQATIRGLGALLDNPKLVSEWAAAGGKQSIEANYFDRAKLQKFVTDRITKDLTPAERAMVVVKSPLTALRKLTGTFEEATRIGEYQAALKQLTAEGMPIGEARRQAAFEARDLQDFAKGGAQTKIVRSLAAFWNAGLQGNIRLAQSFRQRPFQTTLKGLAFITLPKLLEQAVNWNDEDYWDRPQWERDVFFMIPAGKDANGHTRFVRIPTPFEMGIIFGTVPGRVLQSLREKNPEAVKDLPKVMLRQTIPNPTPQAALTLLEVNAGKGGYSFFRDRPIVPSSLQNAPPEMQFTSQNSLTAKKVGDLIGVSPAKVDYAIAGLTGGVGRQLTHQVSDRAISAVTGDARTAESTMPGARFVATPAGTQSEAVERFYKALEEANADAERVKAGLPSQGTARNAPRLNAVARAISDLRKEARMEKDPVKRQAINLQLVERARNAFKPTPNPNP